MIRARTYTAKQQEVARQWHLLDAEGQVLGRLSTQIAKLLRGKHKPTFTPHVDCGDGVVVINAEKIQVTGNKPNSKVYRRYSGYPSGLKEESLRHLLLRRPTEVVRRAVIGMLPSNPIGRQAARRLKIYAGKEHPHGGQLHLQGQKTAE